MENISDIFREFLIDGDIISSSSLGAGNIHDTYLVTTERNGKEHQYILQQFNSDVFRDPDAVMNNLTRLLDHLSMQATEISFPQPVSSSDGAALLVNHKGQYWRCFKYIRDTLSFTRVENGQMAFEGGKMYGEFLYLLRTMDPGQMEVVIPEFHNLGLRLKQFENAVDGAGPERLESGRNAIAEINSFRMIAGQYIMAQESLPLRIVHNDTKISNILFDNTSAKGRAVIDLDTVMPGNILSDYGDMFRSFTASGTEEDRNLDAIFCRLDIFEEMTAGFLEGCRGMLTGEEEEGLLMGGMAMIYMQAVRFLTDHLAGDVYYRTQYPGQNLDRTLNQLSLLHSVESGWNKFDNTLKKFIS